jgi:hypothetical protein
VKLTDVGDGLDRNVFVDLEFLPNGYASQGKREIALHTPHMQGVDFPKLHRVQCSQYNFYAQEM